MSARVLWHVRRAMRAAAVAAALLVSVFLAGCATDPVAPVVVKEAVVVPCQVSMPPRPAFPAESLTGDEDIWTLGTTLWADRLARRAYEIELEVRLAGCIEPMRTP